MNHSPAVWVVVACFATSSQLAQGDEPPKGRRIRIGGEVKAHVRHSKLEQARSAFPFPPDEIPPGEGAVFLRTVSRGGNLELSNAALLAEAELTPHLSAVVRVHVVDLYNRNPSTSDDRIQLREAYAQFGQRFEWLQAIPGTTVYARVGKAPRFTRQVERRLESYGLWGTAVGRFEEVQLELGGSFGRRVYWRGQVASPNPLFFRDTNALAGDNGTPERAPGNVRPIVQTGFPILYDAKSTDLTLTTGKFQLGGGLGLHLSDEHGQQGIDALGWYFARDLADRAAIRGSFLPGELGVLQDLAPGVRFPLSGRRKSEYGANLEASWRDLHLFGQYVKQDIAGLERDGFELELAYRIPLAGIVSGDTPVLTGLQPAIRYSRLDTGFVTPRFYPVNSVAWDWQKWDFGLRVEVLPETDLTLEYCASRARLLSGALLHPNEFLVTLRAGF